MNMIVESVPSELSNLHYVIYESPLEMKQKSFSGTIIPKKNFLSKNLCGIIFRGKIFSFILAGGLWMTNAGLISPMEHDSMNMSIRAINPHYVIHEIPALNEAKIFPRNDFSFI